ncbi:hypothetical protein [[Mycobacterium] crassicus]|uniref:DUF1214 domain-containing protein n=1 Tax=[Mycobacterium] crassicus TaxID=2872309 RepID=A0ABU5XP05_9MYCO|nr:hypothetical protein [Mycolicibacter sp. MYC098]MEB3023941.1 hypothetical protein [Mycolicibacter sp. MYC098]
MPSIQYMPVPMTRCVGEESSSAHKPGAGIAGLSRRERRDRSRRRVRGTTAAATVAAGAFALALSTSVAGVAPYSSATPDLRALAVMLTSGASNPFQAGLDLIVQAQQAITATNSAYPFITDFDKTLLPAYVQSSASNQLWLDVSQLNLDHGYSLSATSVIPYQFNANGAEPYNFLNSPNPDEQYTLIPLGSGVQVVTIHPKPGTEEVTFTPMSGTGTSVDWKAIEAYNLSQFTPNADGSYTVYLSPTEHSGNWVDTSGAQTLLLRDTLGDWGLPHALVSVASDDQSSFVLPVLSDADISSMLTKIGTDLPGENASFTLFGLQYVFSTFPENGFAPFRASTASVGGGPILPGQITSGGHFQLQPDQALIVKVPTVDATYTGAQIVYAWTQTSPYATVAGSLNNTQAYHDPDGYTYYVVSSQNPGVVNWVDNSGLADGTILLRLQGLNGGIPATPEAQVVPVADVSQYLPADTPTVSAAEYAALIHDRLLEYGYAMDQSHDPQGWVTANLEYAQIKAAVGADQFNTIFGGQQDVPSVLDRLTSPALSPDFGAVGRDFMANPSGSLAAIVENWPLVMKDIELPAVLAVLRMEEILGQTTQSVLSGFTSGDLSQVFGSLTTGMQDLGAAFDQALTDPATSIAAGILNARDDLSVSIMNASHTPLSMDDFTLAAGEMSALDQSISQMLSGGLSYLFDSFGAAG